MKRPVIALCFLFVAAPAALAEPVFTSYVARDARREGDGGERTVVNGMEIWTNGSPPRRWEIIGYIADRRHRTGLYGAIRMSMRDRDVVAVARANGGDAVILVNEQAEVVGHVAYAEANTNAYATANTNGAFAGTEFGQANGNIYNGTFSGWGSSHTTAQGSSNTTAWGYDRSIEKENARYAVIRWLEDDSSQPSDSNLASSSDSSPAQPTQSATLEGQASSSSTRSIPAAQPAPTASHCAGLAAAWDQAMQSHDLATARVQEDAYHAECTR
ncbi:MAG: hypothetical protein ABUL73_04600 [Alphaproteobacteria bacterium]